MRYVVKECRLPEDLLTGSSHKRFQALITKASAAGVSWQYSFGSNVLIIENAPAGLESKLAGYGAVEVLADA